MYVIVIGKVIHVLACLPEAQVCILNYNRPLQ